MSKICDEQGTCDCGEYCKKEKRDVSTSGSNELLCEDKPIFPIKKPLFDKAELYERYASATSNKFNKGYFEGKAEMARLIISCLGVNDEKLIVDILNGDI